MEPVASGRWLITWPPTQLKQAPGGASAFRGYNVYRKAPADPDTAFVRIAQDVYEEQYIDAAAGQGSFIYTVRVVDQDGIESADAPQSQQDFVGTWEGEIQLVKGDLAGPLVAAVEESGANADAKENAKISKIQNPQERAQRQKEWAQDKAFGQKVWKPIKELTLALEAAARIGLPIEFDISEKSGKYYLTPRKFLYQDLQNPDSLDLQLVGPATIKVVMDTDKLPRCSCVSTAPTPIRAFTKSARMTITSSWRTRRGRSWKRRGSGCSTKRLRGRIEAQSTTGSAVGLVYSPTAGVTR